MQDDAKKAGAKDGIAVSGICCTANEILMRQGIPAAGNFLHQELAIATGAVDHSVAEATVAWVSLRLSRGVARTRSQPERMPPASRGAQFDVR